MFFRYAISEYNNPFLKAERTPMVIDKLEQILSI